MQFQILGPIRVLDGRHEHVLNPRKVQALLAALLIKSEQVVSTDQIMMEIWYENPPRRAIASLHVYVSQLRKFLAGTGEDGSRVLTRAPGYQLSLGADTVDVHEFRTLLERGRTLLQAGRPAEADHELDAARVLWRGPALGEVAGDGPLLQGFTAWAQEAWLECLELHIRTQLALGRHRSVIGKLHQLISEYPLQESFYLQLMLALYRTDRQGDALRVYHQARNVLNTELSVEPCRALRDLHRTIIMGAEVVDERTAALAS
ncbi:AfsR/SARP family transcriptional regulator [Actinosynnema sp. CS-041913]|uniref:AfsR/SARP family transcriptional regulator n=1 Tax=Actinosynnema sp. CS-041913 TaxID=3239917 RepID=UPI003D928F13